ncbi:MAG: pyridoxamine 5'-phosphate oxidase family protein [Pseudomonadota bacterium]
MSDWWTSLAETHAEVWRRLTRGVADRRAPARHPVLATQRQGGFAEARVIVLRGADREAGTLELHTDSASSKITEIRQNPGVTLLIWEQTAKLQIRLRCHITVATGAETAPIWAKVPDTARQVYGGAPEPGQPIDQPEEFSANPDPNRFAILTCQIAEIETLHLGQDRHRRALFSAKDGWAGQWLAP